ncbi:MAG: site-specific integrase [Acidobacteriota bacterium]
MEAALRDTIDRFLHHLTLVRNVSPHTRRAYASDLDSFARWVPRDTTVPGIDRLLLRGYLAALFRRGLSRGTIARHRATLGSFCRWLHREGHLQVDPADGLFAPRRGRHLPRHLPVNEVIAVLEAPDEKTPLGRRDRVVLETLYATGCRVSELTGLDLDDVSPDDGVVRLHGKGR